MSVLATIRCSKPDTTVGNRTTIGDQTLIETRVVIGDDVTIGNQVVIKNDAVVCRGVVIPDGTVIAPIRQSRDVFLTTPPPGASRPVGGCQEGRAAHSCLRGLRPIRRLYVVHMRRNGDVLMVATTRPGRTRQKPAAVAQGLHPGRVLTTHVSLAPGSGRRRGRITGRRQATCRRHVQTAIAR